MTKKGKVQFWIEYFADLTCLVVANIATYIFFHYIYFKISAYSFHDWSIYCITLFLSYSILFIGFYSNIDIKRRDRKKELFSIFRNATMTYLFFSAFLLLLKSRLLESRYMIFSGYLAFMLLLIPEKYMLKRWITGFFTNSKTASIVGIITTSDIAEEFVRGIKEDWSLRISGIILADNILRTAQAPSYLNSDGAGVMTAPRKNDFPDSVCDIPVISTDESFMEWVRSAPLDEIFININYRESSEIQELVEELEDMGITVHLHIPGLSRMLSESKFDNINCKIYSGYPMATFAATKYSTTALAIKRLADIVFSLIGCILSLPIIAIVAIPLKKESPGPLIFKQQRVGKNGRLFNIYKLRSMYVDAEERKGELDGDNKMDGLMFKVDNDPRITNVGRVIRKYSIDELPQFFNVLKGDMSLIGTRPPTVDEFEQYESRHKRRLSMRPGISGMWQVSGRSEITDFEEVVELDCKYIDEWSLGLDFRILLKTIVVVLTQRGAE